MSYRAYAYGSKDLYNGPQAGAGSISPADVKLDPLSNATTLIANLGSMKVVAEGQFTYNALKQTFADVKASVFTSLLTYESGTLTKAEYFNPGFDGFKSIFGTPQELYSRFEGNDIFVGSQSPGEGDGIRGGPGNDQFYGYGGGTYNDFFNGESGFDVAYLRGKVSEYTIRAGNIYDIVKDNGSQTAGFEVIDKVARRDGSDYYNNVERLYFSDKVVALDIDGNAGQSYRLYKAALNRTPDEPGIAGWIKYYDQGGNLTAMAQMFIDSPEFIAKYGPLDNPGFINQLYRNVLNRDADSAGLQGWMDALKNGASRAHVLVGFSESTENQANVIGVVKNGITYTELA